MIGIIGAMEIEVAGITAALTDHKTETLHHVCPLSNLFEFHWPVRILQI